MEDQSGPILLLLSVCFRCWSLCSSCIDSENKKGLYHMLTAHHASLRNAEMALFLFL